MILGFKTGVSYPQYPITYDEQRCLRWFFLRHMWLFRCDGQREIRAARRSTEAWLRFLEGRQPDLMPWLVTEEDVADWIDEMADQGLKPHEIRSRLRDCDGWYDYIACRMTTHPEEIAGPVFNPFRKLG